MHPFTEDPTDSPTPVEPAVLRRRAGLSLALLLAGACATEPALDDLAAGFLEPPDSARPGVYWYFMDGNLDRGGMTADLESMREAGIGNLVFLEVNVGLPRGPVDFLSEEWQELFVHAVREAERLGLEITLGSGPGWTGSGGPWVRPEQSMRHLVAAAAEVSGPCALDTVLPTPAPRTPYFNTLSDELVRQREEYYEDVAVLAFPTPAEEARIDDVDGKALYYREPFSSKPGVKPFLEDVQESTPPGSAVAPSAVVDLTAELQPDGRLAWEVPEGSWTILRFGCRNNGANTRPAPLPGLGFECDKLDAAALDDHFDRYVGVLLEKVGPRPEGRGWTMLHIDSWEMGAQNWTDDFPDEFRRRRGYDPMPFLPVCTGRLVGSLEQSERFRFDLRLTAQELVLENHAGRLKELGRRHGFGLSIEPYDMNPTADLDLGSLADVPMCEFWSDGFGFDTTYSCFEATSIAHTMGRPVVAAEAFTAMPSEAWKQHPGRMKNQGDWAFALGINRFVYHTFAHQPLPEGVRPGMTMGPYGVHWDRGETWWPFVSDYHRYVTRCQHLLRQGVAVADILYLTPEGAPQVLRPPRSAITGTATLPDRRGFAFDGCSPSILLSRARVEDGRIAFPGGTSYAVLVLPSVAAMTPELLEGVEALVRAGATVVGSPPVRSPSLTSYPECDREVRERAAALFGGETRPDGRREQRLGKGRVLHGGDLEVDGTARSPRLPQVGTWIWSDEDDPARATAPGTCCFRRVIAVGAALQSAWIDITADNAFELAVDGAVVASGDDFRSIRSVDLAPWLGEGRHVLSVEVTNAGDAPNPAGLLAALELLDERGGSELVVTDGEWEAARSSDGEWSAARVLGPGEMAPWGLVGPAEVPELYPPYGPLASLLRELGLREDFTADGPVRYGHRRTEGGDLYFLSSRSDRAQDVRCTFRVDRGAPELWAPVRGTRQRLPDFVREEGRTALTLRFEPYESFFVVFPRATDAAEELLALDPALDRVKARLEGPWEVFFDPALGGPGRVRFAALSDWTARPEPGIRYYSGTAVYRREFDLPEGLGAGSGRLWLDLGKVEDLARVRLNGEELGVVWTPPYRVEITDAVRALDNLLEIEVVNGWVNRLVGDRQAADRDARELTFPGGLLGGRTYSAGRYSFAPLGFYDASSPLLSSGLLGPVTIR